MALTTVPASLSATALTLTTAAQPNITSVGTLTGLSVNANTLTLNGTDPLISLQNGGSNHWQLGFENTQSDRFVIYDNNASSYRLIIDSSGNATFAGTIAGTLATAAQPNITSTGVLNTLSIAGNLTVDTNIFAVDATNNRVGIGTTSPNSMFHVDGSNSGGPIVTIHQTAGSSSADSGLDVETSSTGTYVQRWINSGTELARITGTGRLGIGTNNPGNKLDVIGNALIQGTAGFNASNETANLYLGDTNSVIRAEYDVGTHIMTNNTVRLTVRGSTGNVDIGKSAFSSYPAGSKLNVYGDGEVIRLDGTGSTTRRIRFRNAGAGTGPGEIVADGSLVIKNEDANAYLSIESVRNIEYKVTSTNSTAGHHMFSSYNTEIMRIDGANNQVKVGPLATASATSAPLHVAAANTDVQAVFGDNNATIDDPQIRIIGRNTGNSTARYTFAGLDADNNYGKIGYNGGSGAFQDAIRMHHEGYVQRPQQPFIRCSGNSASRVTNQGTTVDPYTNWSTQVSRGITRSGGIFTVPVAGEYLITYSFYLWMNNVGHSVNHSAALYKGTTMIQESIHEMVGISGTQLWDNTLSNSIILEMSGGDTFKLRVHADIYGGTVHTNVSAYLL